MSSEMVRHDLQAKGRDCLILIPEAKMAVGCADGTYRLGDSDVRVEGERCTLTDGVTIASSMLTMNRAVRQAISFTGVSLVDAVHMASLLPATLCGVADRKGPLEKGKE